ncbi:hypothetical protein [Cellulomonas sp. B6]|uniref:hypothetical protein n=1 Tax=Cellulomonas sp. B6 TaxID=1295626 RepID=UPI00073B2E7B|nr:hypothetical protein [Cellulomonas sp. B6]KSW30087.1 hypothetical protein ATM99_04800 [Cellulomonas sp. B6]
MTDLGDDVTRLLSWRLLDLIPPADVVAWALDQVVRGRDEALLVALADVQEVRAYDVDQLLAEVAQAWGVTAPTEQEAAYVVAADIARDLLRGARTPIDTAREIWRVTGCVPQAQPRLLVFVGLMSEWDDDPAHRAEYDADIRAESARLVAEMSRHP